MQVGFKIGLAQDPSRTNWDGTGPRPLAWTAWYPTEASPPAIPTVDRTWFRREPVVVDAPVMRSDRPLPLVLLSHGTGSTAIAQEWLAYRLARQGFVVLGVNHHGHTGTEPYRAEGFLCMWERATDFRALLDATCWRDALVGDVARQAVVAGFSAGAYAALLLVGARVAFAQFEPDNPVKSPMRGPQEFPDLADRIAALQDNPVFRAAWDRRRDDFSDRRIKAALALAPGRSVLGFSRASLEAIDTTVLVIGGDADTVAPADACCGRLQETIATCGLEILRGVSHHTFISQGSDLGFRNAPRVFTDPPGLDRSGVQSLIAARAGDFFRSVAG